MPRITQDLLVDDVMRLWPNTIRIFLDYHFACPGCPIGSFHSVSDACREYEADLATFLDRLNDAAGQADVRDACETAPSDR